MGEAAAEKDFYWKLFKSTFIISAFTIGGGFVIIPLLKAKFVDEYKWMDDKEALNLVAIAQSAPGAIAVNGAIVVGYKLAGIAGALAAIIGTITEENPGKVIRMTEIGTQSLLPQPGGELLPRIC